MSSKRDAKEQAKAQRIALEQAAAQAAKRKKLGFQFGAVFVVALLIVGAFIVISQAGSEEDDSKTPVASSAAAETEELFSDITQKGLSLGNPDAKVVLSEFVDLQCPFCKQYSEEVQPDIIREYVFTDKVRVETNLRSFLGPDSVDAARFAVAVSQQNLLYQFNDLFFKKQGQENSGYVTEEFLREIASSVEGLDVDKAFEVAKKTAPLDEQLAQFDTKADQAGLTGTPAFLISINGGAPEVFEPEGLSPDVFKKALDDALAKAEGK